MRLLLLTLLLSFICTSVKFCLDFEFDTTNLIMKKCEETIEEVERYIIKKLLLKYSENVVFSESFTYNFFMLKDSENVVFPNILAIIF